MSLPANPTAFWKLEEAAGATRLSQFGGYSLTDHATVGMAAGKLGNAATFVGASSQYLESTDAIFAPGNASYSFAGWFKFTTVTATQIGLARDKTGAREFALILSNTTSKRLEYIPFFSGSPTANVLDTADLVNATYVFCAFGFDKANGKAWIQCNARTRVEASVANHAVATAAAFRVGARELAGQLYMTGAVDALGYWRGYSLLSAEVDSLYNGGTGYEYSATASGLVVAHAPMPPGRFTRTPIDEGAAEPTPRLEVT